MSSQNRLRWRAVLISRAARLCLWMAPEWLRDRWLGVLWRAMFLGPDDGPHRAGEIVLADLRTYAFLDRSTIFDSDPLVMAYREGRRSVALRLMNYLNLDEDAVQKLMEVDDGLGD
ncbi:hypothetical protein [Novosphingobium sp. FKTRR1]|uniref:Bbp19 family protein n=1 Tax=Novosphingobium sp. FKTRR1 TaxID=2879118 RepID=UPI001CF0C62F|nr:hypothetical protein [Novosphingobium sp. FKTRR1]